MIFREPFRMNRSIQIPSWDPLEDSMTGVSSPVFIGSQSHGVDSFIDSFAAIHRYLPSNDFSAANSDMGCDGFSCDHFRMFEFKVRRCARGRSHDWTECPFAHPGEKARRRDPRKVLYSGTACPEFRKGNCKRGESCEFAHGIFECWLHPSRYRTQPCKDGISCRRRVCFFAHSPEELRVLPHPGSVDSIDSYLANGSFVTSPTSVLPSPPLSPPSMNGLVASMHNLSIERNMKMGSQWGAPMQQNLLSPVTGKFDMWKEKYEEEPVMERVESGRDLRNKMYAKLRKDNSVNQNDSTVWNPDIDWVSELLE